MNPAIRTLGTIGLLALIAWLAGGCASSAQQESFATPDDAVNSLMSAARDDSQARLKAIFGKGSEDLISSGDSVADRNAAANFVRDFDARHSLTTNPDGTVTLVVGDKDWPFPVPLVKNSNGRWEWDTSAGIDELLSRRIGRNELDAIQVLLAMVDAQRDYARMDPNGDGIPEYARKFLSDPGTKDGLFWRTAEGEPPSPLGPLAADAAEEGYSGAHVGTGQRRPYHGYYYRMLTAQGPHANGGAISYEVNGNMIGGFAIVAWPAEYGNSGIMTFMVNYDGVVFQKDLGENTAQIAEKMTVYDPDSSWTAVQP